MIVKSAKSGRLNYFERTKIEHQLSAISVKCLFKRLKNILKCIMGKLKNFVLK